MKAKVKVTLFVVTNLTPTTSMERGFLGFFALIYDETPLREREELIKMVGSLRVDENQALWCELQNLKEIYADVHEVSIYELLSHNKQRELIIFVIMTDVN